MIKKSYVVSLYGWYAHDNLGDDLLLESSLNILAKTGCQVVLYGDRHKVESLLTRLPEHLQTNILDIRPRSVGSVIRDAFINDAFMVGGGGIFPTKNCMKVLFYLLVCILYRIRGKICLLAGVSIEEHNYINYKTNRIIRRLIRCSTLFSTRDKSYIKAPLPEKTKSLVKAIPDMVFALPTIENEHKRRNEAVICCANIFSKAPCHVVNDFIRSLVTVMEWLLHKDYTITLLAFSKADESINSSVVKCFDTYDNSSLRVLSFEETCIQYDTVFRNASISICMRFHSLVLSQRELCPYISISYSNKNSALLDDYGLSHWQVPFGTGQNEYLNELVSLDSQAIINLLKELIDIWPLHVKTLSKINKEIDKQNMIAETQLKTLIIKEINDAN